MRATRILAFARVIRCSMAVSCVKGSASSSNFELFFARDAARTPLMVRIPSSLGTISLELSR